MTLARGASSRLARPRIAFCSCEQRRQPQPRRRQHGRHRGVAAEAHRGGRRQRAQQASGLQRAQRQAGEADHLAGEPGAEPAGPDAVQRHARQRIAESLAAPVGDQRDAEAAPEQLARQRLRREHVAAGAAGGERDEGAHASTPPKRRRVNASAMPMASPSDSSDEPP